MTEPTTERPHTVWTDAVSGTHVRCGACGYEWNPTHRTTCRSCDADGIHAAYLASRPTTEGRAPSESLRERIAESIAENLGCHRNGMWSDRMSAAAVAILRLPEFSAPSGERERLLEEAVELIEEGKDGVQCACSVRERDSGHRVDCGVPAVLTSLELAITNLERVRALTSPPVPQEKCWCGDDMEIHPHGPCPEPSEAQQERETLRARAEAIKDVIDLVMGEHNRSSLDAAYAIIDNGLSTPPAQQAGERERVEYLALRNCRALAKRMIRRGTDDEAHWRHVLRFTDEAGLSDSILREVPS